MFSFCFKISIEPTFQSGKSTLYVANKVVPWSKNSDSTENDIYCVEWKIMFQGVKCSICIISLKPYHESNESDVKNLHFRDESAEVKRG